MSTSPSGEMVQDWPPRREGWSAVGVIALSLVFLQIDKGAIGYLVEPMKADFGASDAQMSLLLGLAPVLFYALVGLPMARLADRYRRTTVLSLGLFGIAVFTILCGLAQSFRQLFFFRMFTGTAETVHAPSSYSIMADYFPPARLHRAIGVMQIGSVIGLALAQVIGGTLITLAAQWPQIDLGPIGRIGSWQYVFLLIGAPGLAVAALVRLVREPARRNAASAAQVPGIPDVLAEIGRKKRLYLPIFLALACTSLDLGALLPWRAAFWQREYGWSPADIGALSGTATLVFSGLGIVFGTWLTDRLARRYPDAPLRAQLINYALGFPFMLASPLMPTAEQSILFAAIGSGFSTAGSIPQIAALQIIAPNRMRGQVSAIFLFMFIVMQGLGANVLTGIQAALGGEHLLGPAMALMVAVMVPTAFALILSALGPYRREVESLR